MLTPSVLQFTRPMISSMIFGLLPAAVMRAGFSINVGILTFLPWAVKHGDLADLYDQRCAGRFGDLTGQHIAFLPVMVESNLDQFPRPQRLFDTLQHRLRQPAFTKLRAWLADAHYRLQHLRRRLQLA